jgi:RND family efflux transporter MFP subunit
VSRARTWPIAAVVVLVLAVLVGRSLIARKPDAPAAAAATVAPGGLDLAPADVVVARRIELPRTLEVSGGLKAVHSAIVRARVAGEVKTLTVREGDRVRAGQVVGQLDTTELDLKLRQAEQTAASSRSQLDIASRALENNRALVAQGFISATGLETSISNEAGAKATYQAALSAVALAKKGRSDATLVAPIGGLVSQRLVQPGERVAVDTRLLEIVDLAQLELEAALPPEDVAALSIGRTATLQVDGLATPVSGRVARINPSAQAGTRSIMVYLAVDPQPALRQGLFVRGAIELDRRRVLALPLSAVRTDQAQPYVLEVRDGKAVATPVRLGTRGVVQNDAWVEIVSGLAEGTSVLTAGVGLVRDGTPVRLAPAATSPVASARLAAPPPAAASAVR